MASQTDEMLIAGIRAEVRQIAAEAPKAAADAGQAGVKAGLDAAAAKLSELREGLTAVLNEGLSRIAAEAKASRQENERLRAAGSRPAVVRAVWISGLIAVVLLGGGLGAGYWYGVRVRGEDGGRSNSALTRWTRSRAGREAYALDQVNQYAGGIRVFTRCAGEGWHTEGRTCWPFTRKPAGHVEGWLLPR
jgi:hypothetical protein